MELDESHRHELFDSLQAALGPGPARTLMAHLPPVGWADVATKSDLSELERRWEMRFGAVEARCEGMEARLHGVETGLRDLGRDLRTEMAKQTHALLFGLGSLNLALGGVIVAALLSGS